MPRIRSMRRIGIQILLAVSILGIFSCSSKKKLSPERGSTNLGYSWEERKAGKTNKSSNKDKEDAKPNSTEDKVEEDERETTKLNSDLYEYIESWMGVPHRMGGSTKKGVDCSGLVCKIYEEVYNSPLQGRRAEDIYAESTPIEKQDLQEGDFVFFRINGRRIDHVGIYLKDGNFVHTSSSKGVMVSNLSEAYWQKRYFRGGRKAS